MRRPTSAIKSTPKVTLPRQPSLPIDARARSPYAITVAELETFQAELLEKRVIFLKDDATVIAKLAGNSIICKLRASGKKDTVALQRLMMLFGTAFDKAAAGLEGQEITIRLPACLTGAVEAMIAIRLRTSTHKTTQVIDKKEIM